MLTGAKTPIESISIYPKADDYLKRTLFAVILTAIFTSLLTAVLLCGGAAYIAGGYLIDLALRRGTADNPDAPPAVFRTVIEGNGRAFRPAPKPPFESEPLSLRSFDGLRLSATHFTPDKESHHRWAVILHGYGLSQAHIWGYAGAYLQHGYHVLTPDMRASGESEGLYLTMGAKEARDVADWTKRITEIDPEARIVLHGVSMGAATVMLAAGQDLPRNVTALVEDSGYADAKEIFALELEKLLSLPAAPILDAADLVCEERAGFTLSEAAPVRTIRDTRLPILFIHGTADRLVPFSSMQALFDASPSPEKKRLVIEKIGHGALYQAANYFPSVFAFTDRWTESE